MRVVAQGLADETGVVGTTGVACRWADLDVDPLGRRLPWNRIFDTPFAGFRRLDALSKFTALAVEAAGLDDVARDRTAILLASAFGCLHADRRFQRSLEPGALVEPAVFPYTLPSTCLGELAIRHRITGPNLCLTVAPGDEGAGLDEARTLMDLHEADAAVVCMGDVLEERRCIAVLVVVPGEPDDTSSDLDAMRRQLWS